MGNVHKMADKIVDESKNSVTEIVIKVKSVKKKVEQMPSYPTVRAVDLPFDIISEYVSNMERMRETYEADDGRRRTRF